MLVFFPVMRHMQKNGLNNMHSPSFNEGVSTDSQLGSEYDLHPCDWTIRQPKGRQLRFKLTETYWKLRSKSLDFLIWWCMFSTFVLLYALASPYLPSQKVDRHLYDDNWCNIIIVIVIIRDEVYY